MVNFTDDELEAGRIAYKQGLKWGQNFKNLVENGTVDPNQAINLVLPLGNIKIENFSKKTRFLIELGSTRTGVISNSILVGVGCYTGGSSIMGYTSTTNSVAKTFYSLSILCSGSAITAGGFAVMARACQVSQTAALSDACASAFLILGNQAYVNALYLEGKPIPPRLNAYVGKSLRRSIYDNNNGKLSFLIPGATNSIVWSEFIEYIPFEKIGKLFGITLSLYGYSKLIMASYRYSQQLFNKFKAKKKSLLLKKQVRFFTVRLVLRVDPSIYYKLTN